MELSAGDILQKRFRIIRLLGQGGMGTVYYAHDPVLDRYVAIKQLQPNPITGEVAGEQVRKQFLREAQILASLHHPNLPRVTDFFVEGKFQYLVMDYVEGQSLQEIVQANPAGLDESQVLEWADQLLSALVYVHEHQLIHRDIKPSNIRRTPAGRIFLVDFGLAKPYDPARPKTMTMFHGVGTPEYSPPEQFDPQAHTDERSDLYSLGATLYQLLTGQIPVSVSRRMAEPDSFQPPRRANSRISPEVERVILRAMEIERARRFASAADMRATLQQVRQTPAQPGGSPQTVDLALPPAAPARSAVTRRWRMLGGAGITLIVIALAALLIAQAGAPAISPTPRSVIGPKLGVILLSGSTTPEYVLIQNSGDAAQDLSGWYLESAVGPQVFNFPAGFALGPGQTVRIESGSGARNQPPEVLLWSLDSIWNNNGDKAILRDKTGAAIASQCYGSACP